MTFRIRDAMVEDAPALAVLHVRTFRETHGGGPGVEVRQEQWRTILGHADPSDFTFVVEDDSGALVGFARGRPHDGAIPDFAGELNKIYVLRQFQGIGLGRRLIGRVAERFLGLGVRSMLLFGDARNRSNGFYEHLRAERLVSPSGEFHGGYGWRDLSAVAVQCASAESIAGPDPSDPAA
jgi:GNAT superfamily N-acetyltransferase